MKKTEKSRPYAPDLVDLDTMAYRLCMAARTVQDYVARGWLPKPVKIGNVNRWHWPDILEMVETLKNTSERGHDEPVDEYTQGIDHVAPKQKTAQKAPQKTDDRAA